MTKTEIKKWTDSVIKQEEIDKFLVNGKDFINEESIYRTLDNNKSPDKKRIRDIIDKSMEIKTLSPDETAALLNLEDDDLWEELYEAADKIKKKVYDNRIVFFAPLYCSNLCVNSCVYCGFRKENKDEKRKILSMDEIKEETKVIVNEGHKRLIVVFGEHPLSDVDYMADAIKSIYEVKEDIPGSNRKGEIRRVNVNAAPLSISNLKKLKKPGIGTFQVFQETYDHKLYSKLHPSGIKANYRWRLYALHRAMEAGIDDLAIGALFGLNNWKFEVLGLLHHAIDLERRYQIGPHTISFPKLTPASGSDLSTNSKHFLTNKQFKKLITVLRLAVPYTGLILTAREDPKTRDELMSVGVTQIDASSKIGIGAYTKGLKNQSQTEQQFMLGDTRTLDQMIGKLAKEGTISSFCTAGYRCGRTGDKIMSLLRECKEGKFCKINAVLTFKEYLDDYASETTKRTGETLIQKELKEIKENPFYIKQGLVNKIDEYYKRISNGENDLYI